MRILLSLMIVLWIEAPCALRAEEPHIKVGVIVPFSGGWAEWGERIRQGIELFQSSQDSSSIAFDFVYQDEATCDAAKAFRAYKYLRTTQNIKVFILGCMTGARAILPLAKREGVLLFSAGFEERALFAKNDTLINLALQIDSGAEELATSLKARGLRRLALLREVGTDDYVAGLKRYLPLQGGSEYSIVLDQTLEGTESDLRTSALQVVAQRADALFLNLPPAQLIQVIRVIHEQKASITLLSSYAIQWLAKSNSTLAALTPGLLYTHPAYGGSTTEFDERFRERFKADPLINNYFVHDGLTLLVDAIRKCRPPEKACIFGLIANGTPRSGLGGRYRIMPDGSIVREFEMRRLREGGYERLDGGAS